MKDTRTIQMLASVSLIGGPFSLIIGGVALSTAALVCGIIALVMVRSAKKAPSEGISDVILQTLTRQAVIGIAVSAIAVIMNAVNLIMMLPAMLDAMQTGDYSSLLGSDGTTGDPGNSGDSGGAFGGGSSDPGESASRSGRSSVWG